MAPIPSNPNRSLLDQNAIFQRSFDETTDRIRTDASVTVSAITAEVSVEIDAADGDNIAIANEDGSKKVTITTDGAKNALDVSIINPPSVITVFSPNIQNISIPTAGVEQSAIIPASSKRFSIRLRDLSVIQVSYVSGQSGSNFIKVPTGNEYVEQNLALTGPLTIYFQTTTNSQVLELVSWS